jgi:hypothetical protein
MAVQEVRWENSGSQPADDCTFSYGNGNANHHLGTGFFIHKGIISAVKRVEFISDWMSYITLRGQWCDILILTVHALTEDKTGGTKDRFYEELEHVFDQFLKHHRKMLIFQCRYVERRYLNPTVGNKSLCEISSDNGVRVVIFAT